VRGGKRQQWRCRFTDESDGEPVRGYVLFTVVIGHGSRPLPGELNSEVMGEYEWQECRDSFLQAETSAGSTGQAGVTCHVAEGDARSALRASAACAFLLPPHAVGMLCAMAGKRR